MKEKRIYMLLAIILTISLLSTGCMWSINPINKIFYKIYRMDESNSFNYGSIDLVDVEASVKEVNIWTTDRDQFLVTLIGTIEANYEPMLIVEDYDGTVKIKTQESMKDLRTKENELILAIEVPAKYMNEMKCITISGNIKAQGLNLEELDFSTVSGNISLKDLYLDNLELASVSGNLNLINIAANDCNLNTTSGTTDINDFTGTEVDSSSVSGSIDFSGQADSVELSSTSGDLDLDLNSLEGNITMSTVSGDVTMHIGGNPDYRLTYKTVSGDFNSNVDISIDKISNKNISGTRGKGTYEIRVSTTSGNLNIN